MKYSLRSLMIVAMLAPPVLAGGYFLMPEVFKLENPAAILIGLASMVVFGIVAPVAFRRL